MLSLKAIKGLLLIVATLAACFALVATLSWVGVIIIVLLSPLVGNLILAGLVYPYLNWKSKSRIVVGR